MSNPALSKGLEWNLKVSEYTSKDVIDSVIKTFETYWNDDEFRTFVPGEEEDEKELKIALSKKEKDEDRDYVFFDLRPYSHQKEILEDLRVEREEYGSNKNLVVAATGTGKTGLMGLLPYAISSGRVLIITPQLTIKDSVVDSLDPEKPDNFWLKRKVFNKIGDLPTLIEYEGSKTPTEVLRSANIVILNVQKLQKRLDTSPLNFLPEDFFDMILIDEAHHSTAQTWVDAVNYFSKAKVVKVTATLLEVIMKKLQENWSTNTN